MSATIVVTLGHDGLTKGEAWARDDIDGALRRVDATILGKFQNGSGYWEGQSERCDAWIATIPEPDDIGYLALVLKTIAVFHGQESIGLIIHDSNYGESYVSATKES